ncbi:leucyl/phenylalanyl-tRNA--protein transferase [Stagnihabitans tardus]|uniref:Leucyl/phenylalanyl-tRNA--protein transferase n=1 Tax=Stagnihabitans tardus TaxID=2699202 RepID=A0AAE4Y5D2_9RHOB|nr:leucyl/phenylalanyl-tRNA--protein transferase [Stagnihabitans tardus]NBZ86008.1 leucyl/phenylalanyl-tRNA--protein transferase [Stagnihabitans tardus]
MLALSPEILLRAYAMGIFPMAESREAMEVRWVTAERRGILPIDGFHISRSLMRHMKRLRPRVTVNTAFDAVVRACADRPETWINPAIFAAYRGLHQMGHAHSLEVWEGETLAGGVYGVALGGAFFGESMFSAQVNGSKMALAFLMHRLRAGGFRLFDTQFLTDHLASLGAVEVPRRVYETRLSEALPLPASFHPMGYPADPQPEILQPPSASG